MFCPECGTQLADGTLSCYKCGALTSYGKQMREAQQPAQAMQDPAQQPAQAMQQPAMQQPAQAMQQPAQQPAMQQPAMQPAPAQQPVAQVLQPQAVQQSAQPVSQPAQAMQPMQQPIAQQQAYQQPNPGAQQQPFQQQAYQQQPFQQQPYQQPSPGAQQPYAPVQPGQQMPNTEVIDKYRSLGGWLLLFLIAEGFDVASNLRDVVTTLPAIGQYGTIAIPLLYEVLMSVALAVLSMIFIVMVVQRNTSFLRFYQISTIVRIGLVAIDLVMSMLFLDDLGGFLGAGYDASLGIGVGLGVGLVSLLAIAALSLWLMSMYYCKSERVRVYMGSTEHIEKALFKVGV